MRACVCVCVFKKELEIERKGEQGWEIKASAELSVKRLDLILLSEIHKWKRQSAPLAIKKKDQNK